MNLFVINPDKLSTGQVWEYYNKVKLSELRKMFPEFILDVKYNILFCDKYFITYNHSKIIRLWTIIEHQSNSVNIEKIYINNKDTLSEVVRFISTINQEQHWAKNKDYLCYKIIHTDHPKRNILSYKHLEYQGYMITEDRIADIKSLNVGDTFEIHRKKKLFQYGTRYLTVLARKEESSIIWENEFVQDAAFNFDFWGNEINVKMKCIIKNNEVRIMSSSLPDEFIFDFKIKGVHYYSNLIQ